MEITGKTISSIGFANSALNADKNTGGKTPISLSLHNPNKNVVDNKTSSENFSYAPDIKNAAAEMLKEPELLGEWKDKKGLEQALDPTLGGDIRYALRSTNIDFLKRLRWGGLTVGELREVTHRIRELEHTKAKNTNLLSGKIVDVKG